MARYSSEEAAVLRTLQNEGKCKIKGHKWTAQNLPVPIIEHTMKQQMIRKQRNGQRSLTIYTETILTTYCQYVDNQNDQENISYNCQFRLYLIKRECLIIAS